MKKVGLLVLLAAIAFAFTAVSVENATALPAINKQFAKTYAKSKVAEAAKAAKCNLCHVPKKKKTERNEYGDAISKTKHITKENYKTLKEDPKKLEEAIVKALEEAGKAKSSSGQTFAERIEAGELPAAE